MGGIVDGIKFVRTVKGYDNLKLPSFPSIEHFSKLYEIMRENVQSYQKNESGMGFVEKIVFKYQTFKDFLKLNRKADKFDEKGALKEEREKTSKKINEVCTPVEKLVLSYI